MFLSKNAFFYGDSIIMSSERKYMPFFEYFEFQKIRVESVFFSGNSCAETKFFAAANQHLDDCWCGGIRAFFH